MNLTKAEETRNNYCAGQHSGLTSMLSGTETGPQGFRVSPWDADPDQLTVGLGDPNSARIPVTGSITDLYCGGASLTTPIESTWVDLHAGGLVNGLPILVPDPERPGHYVGRKRSTTERTRGPEVRR